MIFLYNQKGMQLQMETTPKLPDLMSIYVTVKTINSLSLSGDSRSIMLPEGPVVDMMNLDISLVACALLQNATRMKKGTSSTPKINLLLSLWIETVHPPVKTSIEEFRKSYNNSYTLDIEEFLGDNCSIMLPEGPVLDMVNLDVSVPACILLQYF